MTDFQGSKKVNIINGLDPFGRHLKSLKLNDFLGVDLLDLACYIRVV